MQPAMQSSGIDPYVATFSSCSTVGVAPEAERVPERAEGAASPASPLADKRTTTHVSPSAPDTPC
jgi:hypothetical protein